MLLPNYAEVIRRIKQLSPLDDALDTLFLDIIIFEIALDALFLNIIIEIALDKLEAFASFNGPAFYGLARNSGTVTLQREQWTDGANAFALAPGIILLYERNVRTAEELARHGYHIVYEDDLLLGRTELETWSEKKYAIQLQGNELSRARGGPRCRDRPTRS